MNEKKERIVFDVAYQPQVRTKVDTRRLMSDVIIACIPVAAVGVYRFGLHVLVLILTSMAAAVFFEWGYRRLLHKSITIDDFSAAVTGLLLVMVLPPQTPWWMAVIGDAFLTASYAGTLTVVIVDGVTMATPLSYLYKGEALPFSLAEMFLGARVPGSIGEISALAILAGAAYLIVRKVIRWRIPAVVIGTVALISFLGGHAGYSRFDWMLENVLAGGVMFTGIFMATDYSTSPVTRWGQAIYGFGIGALTMLIRYFGGFAEGCSYAILIMNLCTWALDKGCHRHQFGVSREDLAAEKAAKKAAKKEAAQ